MRFGIGLKETCSMCGQFLPDPDSVLKTGVLEVRPVEGRALVRGQEIHLTPTEKRILTLLAANLGELVTYADLYEAGCRESVGATAARRRDQKHALRVHLTRLRHRLGTEAAGYLEVVRGPLAEGGLRLRVV